jgi:outer membrane protein OmpA-like peptidoglycan-associated protein
MIRRIIYILTFGFLLQTVIAGEACAQNEVRVRRSEFKTSRDSFRQAYRHLKKGDSWVKRGKGGFPFALEQYLLAYKYNSDNPELNYKIGIAYLRSYPKEKSAGYLKAAYDKNPEITDDILLLLARAYQYALKFDTATERYDMYYKSLRRRQQKKQAGAINKFRDECKSGQELVAHPRRVVIKNIGEAINSVYDDYNALSLADTFMYFTTRRPSWKRDRPNRENYVHDEDIYVSQVVDGEWQKAEYLGENEFNTKHNEDIVWVSEDGKTIYLFDGYLGTGDILVSYLRKRGWTTPRKISRKFRSKEATESSVCVTRNGSTIYFVSDNKDETLGGKDIYVSRKNQKGKWEYPQNIGTVINTPYDEEGVYVTPDDSILVFSSKGHNTMGGYDIFRSGKDAWGKWATPENIGFPINTPDDEIFYRPLGNGRTAYFAAKRSDTYGGFDIYKAINLGREKKMQLTTEQQWIAYFNKPISDIFARVSGEERIDTTYFMIGMFTDAKRNTPVTGKLDLIDIDRSTVVGTTISDSTGAYRIKLPELKKYGVEVHAKDYMFFLDVVNIPPKIQGRDVTRNFALTKVEVGTKIVLKNIYFETGKAILTPESNTELDKLVAFLKDNTDIKVEISGHTDNVGTQAANTKLSEARAKAVVEYLVAHDILQEKLVYKGYGFSQPMAPNTTAAGRKLNRRVEFKILSIE